MSEGYGFTQNLFFQRFIKLNRLNVVCLWLLGVEFDTEGRVVVAKPGSRVELACRATSYRGGIPVHTWRLPAHLADSKDFTIRRELLPFKPRSGNGTWSPITSESQLSINNAKEEYSGLYECQVAALGANLTEPFYLIIRDPGKNRNSSYQLI